MLGRKDQGHERGEVPPLLGQGGKGIVAMEDQDPGIQKAHRDILRGPFLGDDDNYSLECEGDRDAPCDWRVPPPTKDDQ
jgi:hypothetical protein